MKLRLTEHRIELITLPGFISYQLLRNILPVYKLPILSETLGGLLSIFVPKAIGAGIGVLIRWINNKLIHAENKKKSFIS